MSGHHAAPFQDALRWLDGMLGWAPGCEWMPIRLWNPDREGVWHHHCGVPGSGDRLVDVVRAADERRNDEVLLGLPLMRRFGGAAVATMFWTRVEGSDQEKRLGWFKPAPSLVLREGSSSRRIAFWPLEYPIRWSGVHRGNRNIAHRVGAAKKHAEPERLWIPAPGTCLRRDRARPVPVVVERLDIATFTPLAVIGKLKEAPPADAWMQRQQVGRSR